tara:strand:- start:382 stop:1107 length:726 start_codon:yes stop_codon:yes gene_type:complete
MENQNNELWFNNVNTLFSRNNFFDIIPLIDMNFNEKVNAITRFCLYLSIILIVFTGNLNYLYIPLSVILLFYLVHIFRPKEGFSEHSNAENSNNSNDNSNMANNNLNNVSNDIVNNTEIVSEDLGNCRKPTPNNPLMNLDLSDYTSENTKRACNANNEKISKTIDKKFDDKLYLDTEVIYNTKFNQRNFYTMPNTKSFNDQGAFANWLYNTPVSCAQGNEQALKQVRACAFNNKQLEEMNR